MSQKEVRKEGRWTHGFKEHLENTAGLLIDEAGNTFDTTTAGKAADGGLGYACKGS